MPVRVLVVDDSSLIRRLVTRLLEEKNDIQVIGEAKDGLEAVEQIKKLRPQVVTMDVEMPNLDGIAALKRIAQECPVPVIMLSALTTEGARATMEALAVGAVDFVAKPLKAGQLGAMIEDLAAKIRVAAGVSMRKMMRSDFPPRQIPQRTPPAVKPAAVRSKPAALKPSPSAGKIELVAVGCSTGGPAALQRIIPQLPADLPVGVVVVQHIPRGFSQSLAEHLNRRSAIEVIHGWEGAEVKPGRVIICPAGCETHFIKSGRRVITTLTKCDEPIPPASFRPSVDQVLNAAAEVYRGRILAVLLTGMGRDGAKGLKRIKNLGGRTIVQDEATSVVFGMPKAAVELGAAEKIVPLPQIAQEILQML